MNSILFLILVLSLLMRGIESSFSPSNGFLNEEPNLDGDSFAYEGGASVPFDETNSNRIFHHVSDFDEQILASPKGKQSWLFKLLILEDRFIGR